MNNLLLLQRWQGQVTEAGERWERGSATSSNSSHFDFSSNPGRDSERESSTFVGYIYAHIFFCKRKLVGLLYANFGIFFDEKSHADLTKNPPNHQ